jgi:ArsR family transcriptional regulator
VEALRDGELPAGSIQEKVGIEQANLSQHLAILRSRQIVTNRKGGNQVFYSLRSPVLLEVLDIMRRYFRANLDEAIRMLSEIQAERVIGPASEPGRLAVSETAAKVAEGDG